MLFSGFVLRSFRVASRGSELVLDNDNGAIMIPRWHLRPYFLHLSTDWHDNNKQIMYRRFDPFVRKPRFVLFIGWPFLLYHLSRARLHNAQLISALSDELIHILISGHLLHLYTRAFIRYSCKQLRQLTGVNVPLKTLNINNNQSFKIATTSVFDDWTSAQILKQ